MRNIGGLLGAFAFTQEEVFLTKVSSRAILGMCTVRSSSDLVVLIVVPSFKEGASIYKELAASGWVHLGSSQK